MKQILAALAVETRTAATSALSKSSRPPDRLRRFPDPCTATQAARPYRGMESPVPFNSRWGSLSMNQRRRVRSASCAKTLDETDSA